jgi:Sister chromatid cohesion protein Dcc1
MDLEALAEKGTVALLTLPHSDLRDRSKAVSSSPSSAASTAGVSSLSTAAAAPLAPNAANDDDNDDRSPPLLLLQLPAGWSPRDLTSSHFVSQGSAGSTVSLVCEARNASFAVHTCETSNVLVLVPPRSASTSTGTGSAVHKRRKVVTDEGSAGATTLTTTTTLEEVPARLLRTSGASYLELRPQTLSRQALRQALEAHNPMVPAEKSGSASASAGRGRSVLELSNHLQVSTFEVRLGLRDVGAFCCATPDLYVLLSDQTTFECNQLVVSALGERHIDYSTSYSLHEMTSFVLDRMSDEERFESMDRVIRFCLLQLSDEAKSYDDDWLEDCALLDHDIRFSLSKVRLLSVRTRPTSRSLRVLFCLTLFS